MNWYKKSNLNRLDNEIFQLLVESRNQSQNYSRLHSITSSLSNEQEVADSINRVSTRYRQLYGELNANQREMLFTIANVFSSDGKQPFQQNTQMVPENNVELESREQEQNTPLT